MRLWDLKPWAHKESDLNPSQQPELRCNQMEENTCAFLPLQDRDSTADSFSSTALGSQLLPGLWRRSQGRKHAPGHSDHLLLYIYIYKRSWCFLFDSVPLSLPRSNLTLDGRVWLSAGG